MARVIQLFQVVAVLLIQVGAMASDLVSLKDRVTKVETSPPVHHDTVNLSQQVRELNEAMASQKEHIQTLSQELVEQRAEVSTYRNKMNVLTASLDEDGKEFNQFVKGLHTTLQDEIKEQQRLSSELATVKEDMTQKMGLLHTGLAAVQFDLTVVKSVHGMVPPDIQLRGEVARETENWLKVCEPTAAMDWS
ncbi:hypothetical protein HYDPIDRAFT_31803 [Hydnomerulius pinastri MD-312]|uniref:Uncharacterized protein n=1 Tax=Hydnomerulius pinastri MD-312 TaxID=994086 RepID=A0A0C9V5S0_9AGAM|nr:hypothetical protein HYDPIDRAFT_31803 [Hydnomerulius pinastri MD-312]